MNQKNKLCTQLINQLTQPEFRIPAHTVERFQTLNDRVEVVHIESSREKIHLRLPNGEWVCTFGISQVIDVPPMRWEGFQCEGNILLVLADIDQPLNEWTLNHELCHLLSIGPYIRDGMVWRHSYGINEFRYQPRNGKMICHPRRQDAINELMTDLAVWVLQKDRGVEMEVPYCGLELFANYARACIPGERPLEQLIGGYISGQIAQIRQWLLGGQWESYDALNDALRRENK